MSSHTFGNTPVMGSTVFNEDCMAVMVRYPDKFFDLAIVDPPYGISIAKNGKLKANSKFDRGFYKDVDYGAKEWDANTPNAEYWKELFRVSKNQIVWGGNYFKLPQSRGFVIWDKGETMYERSFAECEYAWVSIDSSARIKKINPMQTERFHPTQKPIQLYEWLLKNYAKQGDKILDAHVGSASSLIACYNLGFDYMGFELDEDYYKAACKRLEARKNQMDIFHMEAK